MRARSCRIHVPFSLTGERVRFKWRTIVTGSESPISILSSPTCHRAETSTASNAHYSNHRDWFTIYTPFQSYIGGIMGGRIKIEGIGDVELRVRNPHRNAGPSYSIITLKDVLYCPTAVCNQVSLGCLTQDGYGFFIGPSGGKITRGSCSYWYH